MSAVHDSEHVKAMSPARASLARPKRSAPLVPYNSILGGIVSLLEAARRASVRATNACVTATYWEIGRRIVEVEQGGAGRAGYGEQLIQRLSSDLTRRFGRGFGEVNLSQMRRFYLSWPLPEIVQTASEESSSVARSRILQTPSEESARASVRRQTRVAQPAYRKRQTVARSSPGRSIAQIAARFPLPWSHYVRLLTVDDPQARAFYEAEALRGGWSVRQLDRQIGALFYERTMLSRNKAAMLRKGRRKTADDVVTPEEEIKDPFILEFLGLKDEYSQSDLEEALVRQIESFLLELGGEFTFVGRQRRLRIGDEWFRIDLLFFHRGLRCLVVIDLKLTKFTHADAGQMHMYRNYARKHWTRADENPPVGLILCTHKDSAVAHYALDGLPNRVMAAEYRLALPSEELLASHVARTRRLLERR